MIQAEAQLMLAEHPFEIQRAASRVSSRDVTLE